MPSPLLKTAVRDSSYYVVSNVISRALTFVVIPVLTRTLSIEGFAIYDLFLVTYNILIVFLTLGMDSGIAVLVAESTENRPRLSFLFVFSLALSQALALVTWAAFLVVTALFEIELFTSTQCHLLFLYTFAALFTYNVFNFARWLGRARAAAILGVVSAVSGTGTAVLCLLRFGPDVDTYFAGLAAGTWTAAIPSAFVAWTCARGFAAPENWRAEIREIFRLSLPFVPTYLGNQLLQMADRIVIVNFLTLREVGLYALLARVAAIPGFVVRVGSMGITPVIFKNYATEEGRALARQLFHIYHAFVPIACVGVYLLGGFVIQIMGGEEYLDQSHLLTAVIASTLYGCSTMLCSFGFSIARKTHQIAYLTWATIALNFVASIAAARLWGLPGVVITTLVCTALRSCGHTALAERNYRFGYRLAPTAAIAAAVTIFVVLTT